MSGFTIHSLDGRYLAGPRYNDDTLTHEDALIAAATRDLTRFTGDERSKDERIFAVGEAYIVSDARGPESNDRVKVLRLDTLPQPLFTAKPVRSL